ncbi:MAG: hypothetical protein WCJ42_05155 [Actinomycetes bacterium]
MPTRAQFDHVVSDVATLQDGLITAAQLAEIGVSRSTIHRRNQLGGLWNRVLPGVHQVTGSLGEQERRRAAVLYCGPECAITGLAALRPLGIKSMRSASEHDDIHVLIPVERRRLSSGFVVVERTIRMPRVITLAGLPFAPPARAIIDAAHRCVKRSDVFALVTEGVARGLVDIAALDHELACGSRRGTRMLREAIEHAGQGAWSGSEAQLRSGLLRSSLPEPTWNVALHTACGDLLAIVDGYYDDVALALEVDSREHHSIGNDWEHTLNRSAMLTAHGVVVMHFTPARIWRDMDSIITEIRSARGRLIGRPLPALVSTKSAVPGSWVSLKKGDAEQRAHS